MYRALIVDDHPFIRASVALLLAQDDIEIAGEADNGRQALQLARDLQPDLAIVDISMPLLDGLTVMQRLRSLALPTKVLVLSSLPAEFYSLRCMKAGACGFVAKNNELGELRKAVRAVRSGYSYFPSVTLSSVRKADGRRSERECLAELSDREILVLHHLAKGYTNRLIGEHLALSAKTVSSYKYRLMEKLGVPSVVGLAEIARRHQLC
ncbi:MULTISPECIES: response regulator transcription factor [Pseudomonas]|uniref:response regulator transcription factor n=1 Tax=Pseudomonas TaxID=286 RepID=UPI00058BA89E|nr:response regulator transcription factor [Pseudomonas massiliensis]